jgi:hypothetical protein
MVKVAEMTDLDMETLSDGYTIPDEAQYPLESMLASMSIISEMATDKTIGQMMNAVYTVCQGMLTEIIRLRQKAGETTQYSAKLVREILKTSIKEISLMETLSKLSKDKPTGTGN